MVADEGGGGKRSSGLTRMDRAWLRVAPRAGLRRLVARSQAYWLDSYGYWGGGYRAGRSDDKALQEDHPRTDSAKTEVLGSLVQLRRRCRNIIRESPGAAGVIEKIASSVVGAAGLVGRPRPDPERLGVTKAAAEEFTSAVSGHLEGWWEEGVDDTEERDFASLQEIVVREYLSGGDVLWKWNHRPGSRSALMGSVQLIEPERVSNPWDTPATNRFAGGIETDDRGRVLAYHVSREHPGETYTARGWDPIPARTSAGERVARLVFPPRRLGEIRGVPVLGPSYILLRLLGDYFDSETQRALTQSLFSGFLKKEMGGDIPFRTGFEADTDPDADTGARTQAEDSDFRMGRGSILEMPPGMDIVFGSPTSPRAEFAPFVEAVERHVGMSVGVPHEVLAQMFRASYTASQGAIQEATKTFTRHRARLTDLFCQPVYDLAVSELVAAGKVDAPGFLDDPAVRRAWCRAEWTGDAPPILDPVKAVTASEKRISLALSTHAREARQLTGTDFRANVRELRQERELLRDITDPDDE